MAMSIFAVDFAQRGMKSVGRMVSRLVRQKSAVMERMKTDLGSGEIEVHIPIHLLIPHSIATYHPVRPSSIPPHEEAKYAVLYILPVALGGSLAA